MPSVPLLSCRMVSATSRWKFKRSSCRDGWGATGFSGDGALHVAFSAPADKAGLAGAGLGDAAGFGLHSDSFFLGPTDGLEGVGADPRWGASSRFSDCDGRFRFVAFGRESSREATGSHVLEAPFPRRWPSCGEARCGAGASL